MKKAISLKMLLPYVSDIATIGLLVTMVTAEVISFNNSLKKQPPTYHPEPVVIETIPIEEPIDYLTTEDFERLYSYDSYVGNDTCLSLTVEESEMLMKLARSEAGDLGIEAQLAIMDVVINRLNDSRFPNTISEIILAKDQFAVMTNGQYKKAIPNADSHVALARLENGEDITNGAIWFESASNSKNSWHSKTREFIFEKYGQRFYR